MDILKSIVLDRNRMAKFTHAISGVLYYVVGSDTGKTYQFEVDMNDKDDVGTTTFESEIKAATMMRYIRKAIKNETLILIENG